MNLSRADAHGVWDAIVVGAGFAGVAAARELGQSGHSVLLLEGRERLGGRTFTEVRNGEQYEFGGAFVHWWQTQSITEVMRYGIELEDVEFIAETCYWPGTSGPERGHRADFSRRTLELTERIFADSARIFPRPFDPLANRELVAEFDPRSVKDHIETLGATRSDAELLSGLMCSRASGLTADVGLLSPMRWYAMNRSDAYQYTHREHYRIVGGTAGLIERMVRDARCTVKLGTPAASVSHEGDVASVRTRDDAVHHSRVVVLAVPLATLHAVGLPDDVPGGWSRVSRDGTASRGMKVIMRAPRGTESIFAVGREDQALTWVITERQDEKGTVLVGFGPDSSRLDGDDLDAVQRSLDEVAPAGITVTEVQSHDWLTDEFSKGTWGFLRPRQLSEDLADLQRPHGRTILAGADLASGWPSYFCGAIESGIRAGTIARAISARGPAQGLEAD